MRSGHRRRCARMPCPVEIRSGPCYRCDGRPGWRAAAHVNGGVVHRDIKPCNVIDGGQRTILADSGIATLNDGTIFTPTGATLSKRFYMAPDRLAAGPRRTPRTLCWLGAT